MINTLALLVERFRRELAAGDPRDNAVVLIGSVARGTAHERSDLDILVVSDGEPVRVLVEAPAHIQYFARQDFLDRLRAGDDFAAWCVRYGVVLDGKIDWQRLIASPEASVWPDWRRKLPHAARRLQLAAAMLRLGDADAASEEVAYLLSHLGRAVLLKAGTFPLSRPEIADQLQVQGCGALAGMIRSSLGAHQEPRWIHQATLYSKKLLVHLDRKWFEAQFKEQERIRKAKSSLRANV